MIGFSGLIHLVKFLCGCLFYGLFIVVVGYIYYAENLPPVDVLKDIKLKTPLQVMSKDGELMAVYGVHRRTPLKYDEIPQSLVNAVIATEDSRFYEHVGVDPLGILRAFYVGIKNKNFSQGGSTITQQVAKNFFLSSEKSIERKAKEVVLAIRMEKELSKQEILALYLNMINFGSRAYGVDSAAYTFFGKKVNQLTIDEEALLAGLPNAPSAYNPIAYPKRALERRNWVLHRMFEQQYITQKEYRLALEKPLNVKYHVPKITFSAPYITEMARQFMYDKFGENAYTDGYTVYTTVSQKEQLAASKALQDNIADYDRRHGYRGPEKVLWKSDRTPWNETKIIQALGNYRCYNELCPAVALTSSDERAIAILSDKSKIEIPLDGVLWAKPFINDSKQGAMPRRVSDVVKSGHLIWVSNQNAAWHLTQLPAVNSALVSLDSNSGAIKAIVGGYHFNLSKFNRATQAVRQIGSNVKPFIYAAGLTQGLTMATILNDAPILRFAGSDAWRPKNYPAQYAGPLRLRIGLGKSKNVMMVRALRAIGIDYAANYLERFGFPKENISHNESLALGSASFTPLQVARAYSVITNGGYLITPYLIEKIEDNSNNRIIYQHQPELACRNCESQRPLKLAQRTSLGNVEDVSAAFDGEEPKRENLKTDDTIILPDMNSAKDAFVNRKYAPQVISRDVAFIIKDALKTNVTGGQNWVGTSWRLKALNRTDVGGKTGTTNDIRDAWFSGFGANIVTTVWMGFDDPKHNLGKTSQEEGGAITASPTWINYMKVALDGVPEQKDMMPSNVIRVDIDEKTGLLPQFNSQIVTEYFIQGTEPTHSVSHDVDTKVYDANGNLSELF